MIYTVECAFTDPARENAWNAFYDSEKLATLLSIPGFRASQRFRTQPARARSSAMARPMRRAAPVTSTFPGFGVSVMGCTMGRFRLDLNPHRAACQEL